MYTYMLFFLVDRRNTAHNPGLVQRSELVPLVPEGRSGLVHLLPICCLCLWNLVAGPHDEEAVARRIATGRTGRKSEGAGVAKESVGVAPGSQLLSPGCPGRSSAVMLPV